MAKHRYSRKRNRKINKPYSRKMRGGVDDRSLHLSDFDDSNSSIRSNNSQLPDFDVESIQGDEENYLNDLDLDLDGDDLDSNVSNSNVSNQSSLDNFRDSFDDGDTTYESQRTMSSIGDDSIGGKRRKKRRKTNKRKSKKSKKTRKNKKRRQRGGIIIL